MSVSFIDGIEGKECAGCHVWKPLSEFYSGNTKGKTQGFRHCRCKTCHAEAGSQRRLNLRFMKDRAVELGIWESIETRAHAEANRRLGIVDENLRL